MSFLPAGVQESLKGQACLLSPFCSTSEAALQSLLSQPCGTRELDGDLVPQPPSSRGERLRAQPVAQDDTVTYKGMMESLARHIPPSAAVLGSGRGGPARRVWCCFQLCSSSPAHLPLLEILQTTEYPLINPLLLKLAEVASVVGN